MKYTCFFIGILSLLMACKKKETPDPVPTTPTTYTKTTIAYKSVSGVDANLLSLDLYYYSQEPSNKPIVVYVHGGAWQVGDKANQITNKVNLFNSLGYIFVSINYRLSTNASVKYPTHNIDVADAVKWVYDNIGSYGGDKNKIALLGHSAGAHLVSLTGTSNQFLPSLGLPVNTLKGVASIDTEGYDVSIQGNEGEAVYLNAFGNNPTTWQEASPINHLFTGRVYPKFFVAKRGSATRIGFADSFINKLLSVGVDVSQVNGSQYDHEGINDAIGASGETAITEPLKAFFAKCFQ